MRELDRIHTVRRRVSADTAATKTRSLRRVRLLIVQLTRFAVAGAAISLISVLTYLGLVFWLELRPILANLFAYLAAVTCGYVLHSRFSFSGHGNRNRPGLRTCRFFAVSLVSLGLNSLFVWLLTETLSGPAWWPLVPMLFVTPPIAFALNRRWVFA